jgi:predicted acyl esterase
MQITHGIRRCRFRNSRDKAELMTPGTAYEIEIEMYPTSNLFVAGHRIRLDISSSNFPHFDINLGNADPEMPKYNIQTNRSVKMDARRYCDQRGRPSHARGALLFASCSIFHHEAYPSRLVLPIQTRSLAGSSIMHEVAH